MTSETTAAQPDTPKIDLDWLKRSTAAAITRREVSQVLGIDERTVTRGIERGDLPSLPVGRRVLIPRLPLLRALGVEV